MRWEGRFDELRIEPDVGGFLAAKAADAANQALNTESEKLKDEDEPIPRQDYLQRLEQVRRENGYEIRSRLWRRSFRKVGAASAIDQSFARTICLRRHRPLPRVSNDPRDPGLPVTARL